MLRIGWSVWWYREDVRSRQKPARLAHHFQFWFTALSAGLSRYSECTHSLVLDGLGPRCLQGLQWFRQRISNCITVPVSYSTNQQLYYCPSFPLNGSPNNMWDVKSSYNFYFGRRLERSGPIARLSMHYVHLLFLQLFSFATSLTRIKHLLVGSWDCILSLINLSHIEFLVELCDNLCSQKSSLWTHQIPFWNS